MHDEKPHLEQSEAPQKSVEERRADARRQLILRRVERIIAHRNTQFILDHQNDSLEQLSAYLKACMDDIGHPPARVEIIGGDFLEYRFGSWQKALRSFYDGKTTNIKNPPVFVSRKIVRDLYESEDARMRELEKACAVEVQA